MKKFKVKSESKFDFALSLDPKRRFSIYDEFAHRKFGEGIYGQYFYGYGESGEIAFVIHPHFILCNKEVHLYMSDEKNNPAVEDEVVDSITEVLGIGPLYRVETMDYDGCYDEFYKRPAYLYVWVADVDDPEVRKKIEDMKSVYLVEMLQ